MHNKARSLFWHTWRWTRGDADGIWVLGMWINYSSCFIPLLSSLNTHDFPKSLFPLDTITLRQRCAYWSNCNCLARSFYSLHSSYLNCHVNTMAFTLTDSVLAVLQHQHLHLLNTWQNIQKQPCEGRGHL